MKNRARQRRYYLRRRREIIAALGGRCCICGGTRRLHIHHKKPLRASKKTKGNRSASRTGAARIREWNDPKTRPHLLLYCEACHDEEGHAGDTNKLKQTRVYHAN